MFGGLCTGMVHFISSAFLFCVKAQAAVGLFLSGDRRVFTYFIRAALCEGAVLSCILKMLGMSRIGPSDSSMGHRDGESDLR